MMMDAMVAVLSLVIVFRQTTTENTVKPACAETAEMCEFHLVVANNWTMMKGPDVVDKDPDGVLLPVRVGSAGGLYVADTQTCRNARILSPHEAATVNTGDGTYKDVLLINGQLPAPSIVVYEGQEVVVHVSNKLANQATTLHWHGLHMRNTPWMDGMSGVSQCAILPGETFTYRYVASPAGTHWYHSHHGAQRTMGLAGPLIILPRRRPWRRHTLPDFEKEFVLMVQDWWRKNSVDIANILKHELISFADGFGEQQCSNTTQQPDGFGSAVIPFESAIINGKGRHYEQASGKESHANLPLESFEVKKGRKYRFRVICCSLTFAFRVSVDHHVLHVIATDGGDVTSTPVESIIVAAGERYDFWIDASDPGGSGVYTIRAETLEYSLNGKRIKPGHVEAILRYEWASMHESKSVRQACMPGKPCKVLNCPFRNYPKSEHVDCMGVSELRQPEPEMTLQPSGNDFTEQFLNFHFRGLESFGEWKPTINGRILRLPSTPFQLYPHDQIVNKCDPKICDPDACVCTHLLRVPLGHVVQLVLVNTVSGGAARIGFSHPVHLHGHQFQVVKIGYPTYDFHTNVYKQMSPDLECEDTSCNRVMWSDRSWLGGNVPGLTLEGAPRKDTVMVPAGGYVVVRFKADNPGFWYMHCHMEYHNAMGMALVMQVGDVTQMNAAPRNMKTCGDFTWSHEEFLQKVNTPRSPMAAVPNTVELSSTVSMDHPPNALTVVFATTTLLFLLLSLFLYGRQRTRSDYTRL